MASSSFKRSKFFIPWRHPLPLQHLGSWEKCTSQDLRRIPSPPSHIACFLWPGPWLRLGQRPLAVAVLQQWRLCFGWAGPIVFPSGLPLGGRVWGNQVFLASLSCCGNNLSSPCTQGSGNGHSSHLRPQPLMIRVMIRLIPMEADRPMGWSWWWSSRLSSMLFCFHNVGRGHRSRSWREGSWTELDRLSHDFSQTWVSPAPNHAVLSLWN